MSMAQKVETLTANQRKTIQLHLKEYRQIINTSDIADKIYLHRHLQECTNRFEQKFKSLPNFENIDWASLEQILVDDRYNDLHKILRKQYTDAYWIMIEDVRSKNISASQDEIMEIICSRVQDIYTRVYGTN